MSRINPIKPKNPWEKVKIFYEKINFYQEIKIFSHQVFLSLYFCFLLSISAQFTTDMARHISKFWLRLSLSPALFQGVDQLSICLRWPPTNPPSSSSSSRDPRTSPSSRGSPSHWGELRCYLPVLSSDLWVIFPGVRSATWRARSSGRLTGLPWATIWPPSGATAPSVRPGGTLLMVGGLCGETAGKFLDRQLGYYIITLHFVKLN